MANPSLDYIINTLFMLFASVLVVFMVPGFAMLEAGLVRVKNVSSVLMINTMIYVLASLGFLFVGYHFAFGDFAPKNLSNYAFMFFEMAFAGKVVNIISGGISERAKILPLGIFTLIMSIFIYPFVIKLAWTKDILQNTFLSLDFHDLAGSSVIHSLGGWALLSAMLIIGPRKGRYIKGKIRVIPASNIPLLCLGAFLLWLGWFGFNGGSVGAFSSKFSANEVALCILNTNTAGLSGALSVGFLSYLRYKKFDITMILNGALGGLVAVSAGADLYNIYEPLLVGTLAGILVVFFVNFFDYLSFDDPVGALSVHLVNGIFGTLIVAFLVPKISFLAQAKAVLEIGLFSFVSSYIVLFVINKLFKLKADDYEQAQGLDIEECGLEAYPEFKRAF